MMMTHHPTTLIQLHWNTAALLGQWSSDGDVGDVGMILLVFLIMINKPRDTQRLSQAQE